MLSTHFPARRAVLSGLLAVGLLSGCATGPRVAGDNGIAVDPSQPVRVALLVPYGTGDPGRDAIARSLENAAKLAQADLRDATIDLASIRRAARPAAARQRRSRRSPKAPRSSSGRCSAPRQRARSRRRPRPG